MRMCEDRSIEPADKLKQVAIQQDTIAVSELYAYLDHRYNTGMFDTMNDPYQGNYQLGTDIFLEIVEALYYPQARMQLQCLGC